MATTIINVRNVHQALPRGLDLLGREGKWKESRQGTVIQNPGPVITCYERPWERVLFWVERDANPFFHLYESLWMLCGRNDVAPLQYFVKNMMNYSDDGKTLHGAYGYRWRNWFGKRNEVVTDDQLDTIIWQLDKDNRERRAVLQMWDANEDLGNNSKDVPCNLTATFQIFGEKLEMSVFCRSNDIIWGAYGANAVHFSMLQEYIAIRLGVSMGHYNQISVNYHAYKEPYDRLKVIKVTNDSIDPYSLGALVHVPMTKESIKQIDWIVEIVDRWSKLQVSEVEELSSLEINIDDAWSKVVFVVLKAHYLFKILPAPERYTEPIDLLRNYRWTDWGSAAAMWLFRRHFKWEDNQNEK